MKKGVIKIVSGIFILSFIVIAIFGGISYKNKKNNIPDFEHEIDNTVDIIKEQLKFTSELNTANYLYTGVLTKADSKKIKGWKIPLTEKSFIIQYDGIVKAGIKNLTDVDVLQDENKIIIKLPDIEITAIEIDNNSFRKLDETNNIFNPISIDDLNDAQKELKDNMYNQALEKGILDMARNNAETVILGIIKGKKNDHEIIIEWQKNND